MLYFVIILYIAIHFIPTIDQSNNSEMIIPIQIEYVLVNGKDCGIIDKEFDYSTHQVEDAFGRRGPTLKIDNVYELSDSADSAELRDQIIQCRQLQQIKNDPKYRTIMYYRKVQIVRIANWE